MSSYAAVMAWPFNSVTNLLFLWKPQTINHSVQSGGRSWKFSTSSLSNDCACIGSTPAGSHFGAQLSQEVRVRSLILHNCGKATESQTRPGLHQACGEMTEGEERASVNIHSRRESVCFSYSSPSFCLCHRCFPVLNPGSFKKLRSKEKFESQRKVGLFKILIHCLNFCWESFIHQSLHKTRWKGKMTTDTLLQRWKHI